MGSDPPETVGRIFSVIPRSTVWGVDWQFLSER